MADRHDRLNAAPRSVTAAHDVHDVTGKEMLATDYYY